MLRNLVAAICVALLIGSSASAGVMVSVNSAPSPGAGFEAWNVVLTGTEGFNVGGVVSLNLTGAHQMFQNAAGTQQTPVVGDTGGTFGNAAWDPFDTHLLVNPRAGGDNVTTSPGFGMSETNDGLNPGGLSADFLKPSNPAFDTFPGSAGIGDLSFTGTNPTIAWLNPQPASTNLLYVVLPTSQQALLSMRLLDSSPTAPFIEIENLPIGGGGGGILPVVGDLELTANLLGEVVGDQVALTNVTSLAFDDQSNPTFTPLIAGKTLSLPHLPTLDDAGNFSWNTDGAKRGMYEWAITGTGGDPVGTDGGTIKVTVTQVPEPATLSLVGLALVGMVGIARRRD
jgi:hypothetical protein